jgi:hypothetical protein
MRAALIVLGLMGLTAPIDAQQPCPCPCGCAQTGACTCGNKPKEPLSLAAGKARAEGKAIVTFVNCPPVEVGDWAVTVFKNAMPGYEKNDIVITAVDRNGKHRAKSHFRLGERIWPASELKAAIESQRPRQKTIGYTGCETGKCTPVREWDFVLEAEGSGVKGSVYPFTLYAPPATLFGSAPCTTCQSCPR